jgi:hypothetical protein
LCNAQLWPSFTKEEAIASWNTRALTEAQKVDVEELRTECRDMVRGYIERTWGSSALADDLRGAFDEFIDHITSNYHLMKKEKKND